MTISSLRVQMGRFGSVYLAGSSPHSCMRISRLHSFQFDRISIMSSYFTISCAALIGEFNEILDSSYLTLSISLESSDILYT